MQKWTTPIRLLCTIPGILAISVSMAQFSVSAQLRTRTEVRNGLGNLVLKGSKAAAFISQRTRIGFGYKWDRVNFNCTLQDVRVWGQDASTISNADGARLMLHEGWAELTLANQADSTVKFKWVDQLSLKIGRQELNYDDVRLIGNLDWLQQARRHDMALLKLIHKGWQADLGFAFNQNSDAFGNTGTAYVPGNLTPFIKNSEGILVPTPTTMIPLSAGGSLANNSNRNGIPVLNNPPGTNASSQAYKSFTSVYISKKFKKTKLSVLVLADRFGKYSIDSVFSGGGMVYGRRFSAGNAKDPFDYSGTSNRFTYGLMINQAIGKEGDFGRIGIQAAYYQQSGKNRDGVSLNAFHYTIALSLNHNKWTVTPGFDLLSGNNALYPTGKDNRFDPLYGTPHRHWGSMDYFYVGTGSPAGGLKNLYVKTRYTGKKFSAGADLHSFYLHRPMLKANGDKIADKLGTEIDLLVNYSLYKHTTIEIGYSLMNATSSMPFAKGQAQNDVTAANYRKSGAWFYAMLKISPESILSKSN